MTYKVRNEEVAKLLSQASDMADEMVEAGRLGDEALVNRLIEQVRWLCQLVDEDTDHRLETVNVIREKNAELTRLREREKAKDEALRAVLVGANSQGAHTGMSWTQAGVICLAALSPAEPSGDAKPCLPDNPCGGKDCPSNAKMEPTMPDNLDPHAFCSTANGKCAECAPPPEKKDYPPCPECGKSHDPKHHTRLWDAPGEKP